MKNLSQVKKSSVITKSTHRLRKTSVITKSKHTHTHTPTPTHTHTHTPTHTHIHPHTHTLQNNIKPPQYRLKTNSAKFTQMTCSLMRIKLYDRIVINFWCVESASLFVSSAFARLH
jgi:hypothetical protein